MRKWILKIIKIGILVISLEGCLAPNQSFNAEKFFSQRKYESEMPFQMADNTINTPLITRKGQLNLNGNFWKGHNLSMAFAISNKIFIEAGSSFSSRDKSKTSNATIEIIEHNTENNVEYTTTHDTRVSYMLNSAMRISSFNIGIGTFKKVGENGCLEFHGGYIHGDANTNYQYSFQYPGYNYYSSTYSFAEGRQLSQIYFQSDFGFVNSWSEGALIARTSYLHYSNQDFKKGYDIPEYKMNADQFVFQPGLHFGVGGSFRIYAQISWNIPLSNSSDSWSNTNFQTGAVIKFKGKPNKIKS